MNIIQTVKDSLYNPIFYSREGNDSFKKAIWYFIRIVLLQAVLISIFAGIFISPIIKKFLLPENIDKVINIYPSDLQIVIKDGIAKTNVKEPFLIPFPEEFVKNDLGYKNNFDLKNILVIDTLLPVSLDRFREHRTAILLTKYSIVANKRHPKGIIIQPLNKFPDMTIDRGSIKKFIEKEKPNIKYILPVFIIGNFIRVLFISIIINFIIVLLASLVILIVAYFSKIQFKYSQIIKQSMYAITIVIVLGIIISLLSNFIPSLGMPWYASLFILTLSLLFNLELIKIYGRK